jgi:hypothetical protein
MNRTIAISEELYARLESEAQSRGLRDIEGLLEEWERGETERLRREQIVKEIDSLRDRLHRMHGEMPDSTDCIREDRERQ